MVEVKRTCIPPSPSQPNIGWQIANPVRQLHLLLVLYNLQSDRLSVQILTNFTPAASNSRARTRYIAGSSEVDRRGAFFAETPASAAYCRLLGTRQADDFLNALSDAANKLGKVRRFRPRLRTPDISDFASGCRHFELMDAESSFCAGRLFGRADEWEAAAAAAAASRARIRLLLKL